MELCELPSADSDVMVEPVICTAGSLVVVCLIVFPVMAAESAMTLAKRMPPGVIVPSITLPVMATPSF